MKKFFVLVLSVLLLVACSNEEERDMKQVLQNEQDVIDKRRTERETEQTTELDEVEEVETTEIEREKTNIEKIEEVSDNFDINDYRGDYSESETTDLSDTRETKGTDAFDVTVAEQNLLDTMQVNYSGLAEVRFHGGSDTFYILPTDVNTLLSITEYAEYGTNSDEWEYLVASHVVLSESIRDTLGYGYTVTIVNPTNISRIFLKIEDGEILFSL